jgi:hypothetical protein
MPPELRMTRRRLFISFSYTDQMKAKGFTLLPWNKNVDVDFVGRHLCDPVKSTDPDYIVRCVREQIANTSVTVVLIGEDTAESDWVAREIDWSLSKQQPNGILGIRLTQNAVIPSALNDCGAEVIEWSPHDFGDAIERAAVVARRPAGNPTTISGCGR